VDVVVFYFYTIVVRAGENVEVSKWRSVAVFDFYRVHHFSTDNRLSFVDLSRKMREKDGAPALR